MTFTCTRTSYSVSNHPVLHLSDAWRHVISTVTAVMVISTMGRLLQLHYFCYVFLRNNHSRNIMGSGQRWHKTFPRMKYVIYLYIVYMSNFSGLELVQEPDEKEPCWRPVFRWKDNIKIDFKEIRNCVDLIHLAQDRDKWWWLFSTQ